MRTYRRIALLALVAVLVLAGTTFAYRWPPLASDNIYTKVLLIQFKVQELINAGSAQDARLDALEAAVAALQKEDQTLHGRIDGNAAAIAAHVDDVGNAHQHDSRYVRDSGEDLRVIRGYVRSGGSISSGDGFTVTKGGTGTYTINFDAPFGGNGPEVFVHAYNRPGPWWTTSVSISTTDTTFTFTDGNGNFDTYFSFVIIGLQL